MNKSDIFTWYKRGDYWELNLGNLVFRWWYTLEDWEKSYQRVNRYYPFDSCPHCFFIPKN